MWNDTHLWLLLYTLYLNFKLHSFETPQRLMGQWTNSNNCRTVFELPHSVRHSNMSRMYGWSWKEKSILPSCATDPMLFSLIMYPFALKVEGQIWKSTHFWEINIFATTAEFVIWVENLLICTVNGKILKNVIYIREQFLISEDAVAS